MEDDPADAATEQLAAAHGARYVALGAPRGLNVARNAAVEAAEGELLCFLDDDVAAWPDWLGALLAAAGAHPGHEAFGGPIRAAAGGHEPARVRARAGAGDDARPRRRRTATPSWCGARTSPSAAAALERVGAFDPARSAARATRRSGSAGCAPRAAASATSRRPESTTAAPARTRASAALARAAWHRGRHARRFDEAKGTAPLARGRAAHAGRLRVAHRPLPLRQRDRADRADGGTAARGGGGARRPAGDAGRGRASRAVLPLGAVGDARPARAARRRACATRAADALTLPRTRAVRRAARTAPPRAPRARGRRRPARAGARQPRDRGGAAPLAPRRRAAPRGRRARRSASGPTCAPASPRTRPTAPTGC